MESWGITPEKMTVMAPQIFELLRFKNRSRLCALQVKIFQVQTSLHWASVNDLVYKVAEGVEIDPIMYRGSNGKSMAASSCVRFPLYFHFRFGRKWLSDAAFRRNFEVMVR